MVVHPVAVGADLRRGAVARSSSSRIWATLGYPSRHAWFGTHNGIFVVTLITIALAGILVSIGMAGYARVQKWCFIGGVIGFAIIVILLLINQHGRTSSPRSTRDQPNLFGMQPRLRGHQRGGREGRLHRPTVRLRPARADACCSCPVMMFYLLWPNWGTTLYGEIRGASDFKRVFTGMFFGLWTTVAAVRGVPAAVRQDVRLGLLPERQLAWLRRRPRQRCRIFPYPVLIAGWLVHNTAFQVILLLVMSLWFFGWVGTLFLSSTRVIFAAAFDRVLPDAAAQVSEKRRVPVASLVLMLLPAVGLAALYAYNTTFATYTLDATLVIAVTYLGSAIAVVILPLRKPDLWAASPASKFKVLGVPIVPVAGVVTIALLVYNLYEWLSNDLYGVNHGGSLIYMGAMYVLAIVIYVGARIVRRRQGIDLGLINKEIPVE